MSLFGLNNDIDRNEELKLSKTSPKNLPRNPNLCVQTLILFFFLAVPLVMLWPLGFIFPPLGRVLTPMLGPTDLMLSCLSRRTPRSAPFLRVESWWSPYKHTYTTHKKTHMDAFFTQNNHRHTAIVHTQMLTHIHTHTHTYTLDWWNPVRRGCGGAYWFPAKSSLLGLAWSRCAPGWLCNSRDQLCG